MRESLFKSLELSGIIICMTAVTVLRNVYYLSGETTTGILFGSVNNSIWENTKPLILVYILYGLVELMWARPCFRRVVSAKAVSLYIMVVLYIVLISIVPAGYRAPVTLFALSAGFISSALMTLRVERISGLFFAACFMLLLIFIMYFSFTAFPPRLNIFLDKETGMYGIIPKYIDIGALYLD